MNVSSFQWIALVLAITVCGTTAISRRKRSVADEIDHEYAYGIAERAIAAPVNEIPIPDLENGIVDLISSHVPAEAAPGFVQPEVVAIEPPELPIVTEPVVPNVPFLIHSETPPIIEQEVPAAAPVRLPPTTISRTYKVAVPVKVPYPIPRNVPVPIPQPYPVVITKNVPFEVSRPYPVPIEKQVPVPVKQPYPVPVPVPVQNNNAAGVYGEAPQSYSNFNRGVGGFWKQH